MGTMERGAVDGAHSAFLVQLRALPVRRNDLKETG